MEVVWGDISLAIVQRGVGLNVFFHFVTIFCPSSLSRCSYILDPNGEARGFRPRDRDEMVKQVRLNDLKLQYAKYYLNYNISF